MQQAYAPLIRQMLADFEAQNFAGAERTALSVLKLNSKDSIALQILGLSLAIQGKASESIEYFQRASLLEPKNSEILNNLVKAQFNTECYEDAVRTYEKLLRLNPDNPYILTDYASCLLKLKHYDKALLQFDKAIKLDPNYYLLWSNLANLYSDLRNYDKALECHEKSLSLNEDFSMGWTHYGNTLFSVGRLEESKLAHEMALSINPNYAEAWLDFSVTLLALNLHIDAYKSYQKAFALKPHHPYLIGSLFAEKLASCVWDDEDPTADQLHSLVLENQPVAIPYVLLLSGADLQLQKQCAIENVKTRFPVVGVWKGKKAIEGDEKIRIGYFSTDFKSHPVGILMKNIIQLHDRDRFEVYGFFLNRPCNDEVEQSLIKEFDHSYNLSSLSDAEAVEMVRSKNIDIAIDLNGHTAYARTNIFASRVASVQVNYLGYAGTLGAEFYDYIVADRVVIPPEHHDFYTEEIAYLPHSFFPVDTTTRIEEFGDVPQKIDEGLPEKGFIFCCFNNAIKFTPQIFSVWMELLKQVPDSVLWLLKPSELAIDNLKAFAISAGVDPNRIIFARFVPGRKMHLSRMRLIDLFLDTPTYNAHATAADALWAGVPVLTLLGQTFAGRVAASMNHALDMECMVTNSIEEYFNLALRIAKNPEELSQLKNKIALNRNNSKLFDSKQYVQDLEGLFTDFLKRSKN